MAKAKLDKDVRIVIAPFGWVFVGVFSREYTNGKESLNVGQLNKVGAEALSRVGYTPVVKLTNASVIRKWGTTQGLGQLITGPVKDTVLDPCGTVEIHEQTVVAVIQCVSGWEL